MARRSETVDLTKELMFQGTDDRPAAKHLLANIKSRLHDLRPLLKEIQGHHYEDGIYRFYHSSWKVYDLQKVTERIVEALKSLAPGGTSLNSRFLQIVAEGTGRKFQREDNKKWNAVTRPMVEAYLHGKYFLEMVVKYGRRYRRPPAYLDDGWAAVLYLYNLR